MRIVLTGEAAAEVSCEPYWVSKIGVVLVVNALLLPRIDVALPFTTIFISYIIRHHTLNLDKCW